MRRRDVWWPLAAIPLAGAPVDLLEDLSHRAFAFFWEHGHPDTGLVLDRARNDDRTETRRIASIAATGFGLTALCIGAEQNWIPRDRARERVQKTLRFFNEKAARVHGWFYHFLDNATGDRQWKCELSSIDTALLMAGVLTARQYFHGDAEIVRLASSLYDAIDFRWMLNGDPYLLSHGWKPESGFLKTRWDAYCEHSIVYLLAIGSTTSAIPPDSWYAWRRPRMEYDGLRPYIAGARPLFIHQFSHAWIDFRGRRENRESRIDYFQNSIDATLAHRQFCIDLASKFPGYSQDIWGITASDSAHGYVAWGGPPPDPAIDGTVVPCAAAGSLMFTPDVCVPAIRAMKQKFGDRIYGRYGFADAFHPTNGWVDQDVIGIDQGITLLSAENLRSGNVWRWFMANGNILSAMDRAGFVLK